MAMEKWKSMNPHNQSHCQQTSVKSQQTRTNRFTKISHVLHRIRKNHQCTKTTMSIPWIYQHSKQNLRQNDNVKVHWYCDESWWSRLNLSNWIFEFARYAEQATACLSIENWCAYHFFETSFHTTTFITVPGFWWKSLWTISSKPQMLKEKMM